MDWLQFAVQWLHVIAAITWFGAVIYNDFILIPGLMKLPVGEQRSAGGAIGSRAEYVLMRVAPAVIILGFLRGTVFGRIHSLDTLTTNYGLAWLVSLVVASFTLYWGVKVIGDALVRFNAFDVSQATLADGSPNPTLVALLDDLKRKSQIELLFFLVIFTCMIFMRFN